MVVRTTLSNIKGLYQVQILPLRPVILLILQHFMSGSDGIARSCQRRRDNASARRRENTSMMLAKRPPNWGPFRKASGLGGGIRRRVQRQVPANHDAQ